METHKDPLRPPQQLNLLPRTTGVDLRVDAVIRTTTAVDVDVDADTHVETRVDADADAERGVAEGQNPNARKLVPIKIG